MAADQVTPWVTLVLGLAASPAIKAIVEAIRDRMVARGRIKSRADHILMWAWELLEHIHELRVMLIKRGVAEDDLPKIPPNPLEGQK